MNDIKDALTRAAATSAPAPLALETVRGRARQIRRRRTATALAGTAAAVAAIAGLGVAVMPSRSHDGSVPPATTGPASPSGSPSNGLPVRPTLVTLRADLAGMGSEPRSPYWFDGAINLPDGSQVPVPDRPRALAPLGSGWAVLDDNLVLSSLGADGAVEWKGAVGEAYAVPVSADHTVLAYVLGTQVWAKGVDDAEPVLLGDVGRRGAPQVGVAGVEGSTSCADGECRALVNVLRVDESDGSSSQEVDAVGGGEATPVHADLLQVRSVRDGVVAGLTSVHDDGSCSAVVEADDRVRWGTCDYTLEAFSPDGRYVLAGPAYLDGAGSRLVAVLDAATGRLVREFRTQGDSLVNHTVWESPDTLLAAFWDGGWSIMRLSVDGTVTKASSGRAAGEFEQSPFLLLAGS